MPALCFRLEPDCHCQFLVPVHHSCHEEIDLELKMGYPLGLKVVLCLSCHCTHFRSIYLVKEIILTLNWGQFRKEGLFFFCLHNITSSIILLCAFYRIKLLLAICLWVGITKLLGCHRGIHVGKCFFKDHQFLFRIPASRNKYRVFFNYISWRCEWKREDPMSNVFP